MAQKKFQGRVAIVSGAGRGIGCAAAQALASAGAAVVGIARTESEIKRVVDSMRRQGQEAIAIPGDVSDLSHVEQVVETTLEHYGRVDILVNNAGQVWPVDEIMDADPEEWAYAVHVNLVAQFYMTRSVLPLMIEQEYGRIVTVGADPTQHRLPGGSAFHSAKAGLDMFCDILAQEIEGTHVLANMLYPGMVDTELQADIRNLDTSGTALDLDWWIDAFESGELIHPREIGQMILWLCGPWVKTNGSVYRSSDSEWIAQLKSDLN